MWEYQIQGNWAVDNKNLFISIYSIIHHVLYYICVCHHIANAAIQYECVLSSQLWLWDIEFCWIENIYSYSETCNQFSMFSDYDCSLLCLTDLVPEGISLFPTMKIPMKSHNLAVMGNGIHKVICKSRCFHSPPNASGT